MPGSYESLQWNACVHRLDLGLNSHPKEFKGMKSEAMLSQRQKSLYQRLRERSNPQGCIMQDYVPNTLLTELFRPPTESSVESHRRTA